MYSANDLAKATQALRTKAEELGNSEFVIEDFHAFYRTLAKAALDAQYLPAHTPPSEGSAQCMIFKGKVWQE